MQFPLTADGRALDVVGLEASRVNQIIEDLDRVMARPESYNSCADPLGGLESLVADLPDGSCISYQRSLWHKDQVAIYRDGRKVEVVYRHSGNGTVTYLAFD